jgi:hypothetical protein
MKRQHLQVNLLKYAVPRPSLILQITITFYFTVSALQYTHNFKKLKFCINIIVYKEMIFSTILLITKDISSCKIFMRIYLLYRGDSLWQFQIDLYLYVGEIAPTFSPSRPLPCSHLKELQEVSLFYFIQVYEVHQSYSLTLIPFIHPPPFQKYLPPTVSILQSCLLLLIFKSMFKGVSQCISAVGILYFGLFNPFHC